MSYDKKESLVSYSDWDAKSDSHPAMKWMREYTNKFDGSDPDSIWNEGQWLTKDFTYAKADGQVFPPGKESWDAARASYQFFTSWYHEPYFFTCWELDDKSGWAMTGNAQLHYNLPGDATAPGVKDQKGQEWQMRTPGGFYFEYKKDQGGHDGIRLDRMSTTSDSGPAVVELLKRGVLKPQDLGL